MEFQAVGQGNRTCNTDHNRPSGGNSGVRWVDMRCHPLRSNLPSFHLRAWRAARRCIEFELKVQRTVEWSEESAVSDKQTGDASGAWNATSSAKQSKLRTESNAIIRSWSSIEPCTSVVTTVGTDPLHCLRFMCLRFMERWEVSQTRGWLWQCPCRPRYERPCQWQGPPKHNK